MTALQEQLHSTTLYFDMFDYAPTLLELERWLLTPTNGSATTASLSEIEHSLAQDPRIDNAEGFYFLNGRDELVERRKEKYNNTDKKWKHAKPFLRLLATMPGVESIWLTNSMGWGNARKTSDVDLFIVTTPGKIWSARFFTTALMKLFRQRPHEQSEDKAICLSMYLAADHLNMETYKIGTDDIHFTFWVNQIYPIYDSGHYQTFQRSNQWLTSTLQRSDWIKPIAKRSINLTRLERALKKTLTVLTLEKLLRRIQLHILPPLLKGMANEDNRVVINDKILKLHTNDRRQLQQHRWERKLHGGL